MRSLLGTISLSGLSAGGYVAFNGVDRVYDLSGLGLSMGGSAALAVLLAAASGAFAVLLGLGHVVRPTGGPELPEGELSRIVLLPMIALGVALLTLAGYLVFQGS